MALWTAEGSNLKDSTFLILVTLTTLIIAISFSLFARANALVFPRIPSPENPNVPRKDSASLSAFLLFGYVSTLTKGRTRKAAYVGTMAILLYLLYGPITALFNEFHGQGGLDRYLGIMIVALIGLTYKMVAYSISSFPTKEEARKFKNDPRFLAQIGVIVPCHKSEKEIALTLRSIMRHLPPENIIVIDNANQKSPPDRTQDEVKACSSLIRYLYIPMGLKTNAMWEGLKLLPKTINYVVHIDDDTLFPSDMVFDFEHFKDDAVSAVSYGIRMVNPENPPDKISFTEQLVDREFLLFSQWRLFRSNFSTCWFCHGIIGLWRRERLERLFLDHPFLPFGEDGWFGMMNLLQGDIIRQELRSICTTFAPTRLFPIVGGRSQGYGASSVWKQRAYRWYVNAPRRFVHRTYLFVFFDCGNILCNLIFRIETLIHLGMISGHLGFPIIFLVFLIRMEWMLVIWVGVSFLLLQMLGALFINFVLWRHRPDIQQSALVCLSYPFYTTFLHFAGIVGNYKCLLYYLPNVPMRMGKFTQNHPFSFLRILEEDTHGCTHCLGLALKTHRAQKWHNRQSFAYIFYVCLVCMSLIFAGGTGILDFPAVVLGFTAGSFKERIRVRRLQQYVAWSAATALLKFGIMALWISQGHHGSPGLGPTTETILSIFHPNGEVSRTASTISFYFVCFSPFLRVAILMVGVKLWICARGEVNAHLHRLETQPTKSKNGHRHSHGHGYGQRMLTRVSRASTEHKTLSSFTSPNLKYRDSLSMHGRESISGLDIKEAAYDLGGTISMLDLKQPSVEDVKSPRSYGLKTSNSTSSSGPKLIQRISDQQRTPPFRPLSVRLNIPSKAPEATVRKSPLAVSLRVDPVKPASEGGRCRREVSRSPARIPTVQSAPRLNVIAEKNPKFMRGGRYNRSPRNDLSNEHFPAPLPPTRSLSSGNNVDSKTRRERPLREAKARMKRKLANRIVFNKQPVPAPRSKSGSKSTSSSGK
ncbi:hypothetical protein AAMO2058_001064800 [Amorphochlora amoebiformis]